MKQGALRPLSGEIRMRSMESKRRPPLSPSRPAEPTEVRGKKEHSMGITLVRKISTPGREKVSAGVSEKFPLAGDGLGIPGMKGALRCARWFLGRRRRGWFARAPVRAGNADFWLGYLHACGGADGSWEWEGSDINGLLLFFCPS